MTTRALTAAEHAAFRLARLRALDMAPYCAHALLALRPVAAPGLGTFAIDAWWRLYMDPAMLDGPQAWPPADAAGVLLHETWHALRDHAGRCDALPQPPGRLAWNLAADAEINDDLIAAAVPLPAGVVTPASLGQPDGRVAEEYYAALRDPAARDLLAGCDDGGPGCGSGAGSGAVPGELPAADATLEDGGSAGIGRADADLVRRRVAEDITAGVGAGIGKGRGTMPAGLDRWASRVLAPPVIAWSTVLRSAVRRAVASQAGRTDYSYARPSRRRVPGIVKPSMRGPAVRAAVVVDTSGSMGQSDLDAALSEIAGVLRSTGIDRDHVSVLCCDAEASQARRVRSVSDVRLTGGGGTDMRVGITAALAARPAPHVVVVLTDGDTPWPGKPTAARLVCAVISDMPPYGTPPWATTVHVPAA
jgi:predicted metal-dependent peptidase